MAKVEFNRSISGVRGKVDRWVYREQHGRTVIVPHKTSNDSASSAQLDRRERFRDAQAYAASVLADPLKRECYRKLAAERKCPPNALLISNFLNPPEIEAVDLASYEGRVGDSIRVVASDAIEVVGVTVTLRGADNAPLESGSAVKDHDVWGLSRHRIRRRRTVAENRSQRAEPRRRARDADGRLAVTAGVGVGATNPDGRHAVGLMSAPSVLRNGALP